LAQIEIKQYEDLEMTEEKKPIQVFIIEDQAKILKQQVKVLSVYPEVEVVGNALSGETGLKELEKVEVDVLLLDLGLPLMDGIEVTKKVKEKWPDLEILIFTIFDEEDRVINAIRAGASGYLLKGTPGEKIVEAIREVFDGGTVIQPNLARNLLKQFQNTKSEEPSYHNLSNREAEILQLVSKGLPNHEVGEILGLTKATIRTHLEHIYKKLDVTNRVEAVTEGIRKGIIEI